MYRSNTLRQATQTALAVILLSALLPATGVVSQAHAWWGCNNGYQLQIRGNTNNPTGAQCVRPGAQVRKMPNAGCPIGTTYNRDHSGNNDYCLPVAGSLIKRFRAKCGPGQSVTRRNGADRCYVTQPVSRTGVTRNIN